MGIRYYRLFDLLARRGMKKSDLRKVIAPKTVAKLSKGEYISGDAIEKICLFLQCQPGDIMEVVVEDDTQIPGTKIISKNIALRELDDVPSANLIYLEDESGTQRIDDLDMPDDPGYLDI